MSHSIADTLHSVLLMEAVYEYTIKFFGQYENLAIMVVSSQASVMVAGVIAFAVQVNLHLSCHTNADSAADILLFPRLSHHTE